MKIIQFKLMEGNRVSLRINVAVLAEELIEIYSTPTPKGWMEPKK